MGKVYTGASMSLDGYISSPADPDFEHLLKWYSGGDVAVPTADPDMTMQMDAVSAQHFRDVIDMTGALVVGRRLFDQVSGWGGNHPMGVPVVVLSHSVADGWPREDAPVHFVSDGIHARSNAPGSSPATRSRDAACSRTAAATATSRARSAPTANR